MSVNLANRLRRCALEHPDKPAVILCQGPGKTGSLRRTQYTFAELDRDSDAAARGLLAAGIGYGCKTLIMLRPSLPFFSAFFALFKVGAVPVFIDPGMGGRRLLECVRILDPEAMIGIPLAHAIRKMFRRSFPGLKTAVTAGRRWFWGGPTWEGCKVQRDEAFPIAETGGEDLAAILFTTGSTGPAKGVEYTHAALDAQVDILSEVFSITPDDKDCATFPGFSLFSIALGMTATVPDMDPVRPGSVFPPNIVEPITRLRCTFSFGSPALWRRVSAYCREQNISLPALRRVVMAGAPVPLEIHRTLLDGVLEKGAETYTPYGATEVMPVSYATGSEILATAADRTADGGGVCVGRPVRGVRVEIIAISDHAIASWSDDLLVEPGRIGEITVQADHASRHYHNLPQADALAKIADGNRFWHRMGDVGYVDGEGRIWFCGRKAHRVRTADGDLFTIPVETVFNQHPAVTRSALVGVDNQTGYQTPVLVIETEEPDDKKRALLREELVRFAHDAPLTSPVRDILFHPRFPTDIRHNAKIRREDLARWAAGRIAGHG